jgi:hypothetical protein
VIVAVPGWRSGQRRRWPRLALGMLIGVARNWVVAQHQHSSLSQAAEEVTACRGGSARSVNEA